MKLSRQRYVYTLDRDIVFNTVHNFGECVRYYKDEHGKIWMSTKGSQVIVEKGYSWDGCTPKFKLSAFGRSFIFGTPDGKNIYHKNLKEIAPMRKYASLLHDVLCQFHKEIDCDSDIIHDEFFIALREVGDKRARLYLKAVRFYWNKIKRLVS